MLLCGVVCATTPRVLRFLSTWLAQQLNHCGAPCSDCRHIVGLMRKAPESSLRAVYKKHCSSKFGEVAKLEVPVLPEATDV